MPLTRFIAEKTAQVQAKRARRKEARPGELLDAAMDLFVEKGFAATRAEEVAARAGVSKGTLFLYFQSKEDLFKAVVRQNISGVFPQWNAEFATFEGTSAQMLHYAMNQWWERLGATRASGITKLVMAEARNFPEIAAFFQHEVMLPGHDLIRRVLQRGVDSGEFRALNLDYAVYAVLAHMVFLNMTCHSEGLCQSPGFVLVPQDYIAAQVDILVQGMLAPKASRTGGKP